MLRGPTPLKAPDGAPKVMSFIADSPFDMRQYSIEGLSGFLNTGPKDHRPHYSSSNKTLVWPNGAKALLFSAEDPETLRGASGAFFWWDELAKSRYAQAGWDNMMFGLREGTPRGIVTTTPRPMPLLKKLSKQDSTHVTVGSTWDNEENLSPVFYEQVITPLMGTRLGRQEIDAEILEDAEGALWSRDMIRHVPKAPDLGRIVVAIDPPAKSTETSDLCGIVVAGLGIGDGRGYVLADYSARMTPGEWAQKAIWAYDEHQADRIVAESNQGGEMVSHTLQTVRRNLPITLIHANRSKQARAEPVSALYERGMVDHVGPFPELEDQLCSWEPFTGDPSPDRLDAMVYALTELAIGGGGNVFRQSEEHLREPTLDRVPATWARVAMVEMDTLTVGIVWAAHDRVADVSHIYDVSVLPRTDLAVIAAALRDKGKWIPVLFNLESPHRSRDEGVTIAERLAELQVELLSCEVRFEDTVDAMVSRLSTGRVRVGEHLSAWLADYRRLRRDAKGKIVADGAHLIRATTVLLAQGLDMAISENLAKSDAKPFDPVEFSREQDTGLTGY